MNKWQKAIQQHNLDWIDRQYMIGSCSICGVRWAGNATGVIRLQKNHALEVHNRKRKKRRRKRKASDMA